MMHGQQNI